MVFKKGKKSELIFKRKFHSQVLLSSTSQSLRIRNAGDRSHPSLKVSGTFLPFVTPSPLMSPFLHPQEELLGSSSLAALQAQGETHLLEDLFSGR